jgi:hypothetical protein
MGEIRRIERISYNSGRVERVTRYSPEERAAKIKEIEQAAADRAEIRALLAKYPNPAHLSFAELLEQALKNQKLNDDELAYILDIGNQQTDTSGVIVDISSKK